MLARSRSGIRRRLLGAAAALCAITGLVTGGESAWIFGKALLAQGLLAHAWEQAQSGAERPRPWPWADTWPVARVRLPGRGKSWIVLAGASGRTMAFGPGHLDGTPLPGEDGNAVLAGHRDTHFALLRQLRPGDELVVDGRHGQRRRYRVTWSAVLEESDLSPLAPTAGPALTLITCYPFDALVPGGPLRFVVRAEATTGLLSGDNEKAHHVEPGDARWLLRRAQELGDRLARIRLG